MLGRRADGYHDIESLVAFADVGDELTLTPADALGLSVRGPNAAAVGRLADNLVLKAAGRLRRDGAGPQIRPVRTDQAAAGRCRPRRRFGGRGGGAAAARARITGSPSTITRLMAAARATGADVPVCLDPRPRLMRGIGDILSAPLDLPPLPAVLVNPGVALATKDVFAAFHATTGEHRHPEVRAERASKADAPGHASFEGLATPGHLGMPALSAALAENKNDLEPAAISLRPVIADVLAALRAAAGCGLARMSGSGATCFGLFDSADAATKAARRLRAAHAGWWVRATKLG